MKTNRTIVNVLLLTCFVLYFIIEMKLPWKETEKQYRLQTDMVCKRNDSLKEVNTKLDEKLQRIGKEKDSLILSIHKQQQTIEYLKREKKERRRK